jgi:hypothetical protein
MKIDAEAVLRVLEGLFGREDSIHKIDSTQPGLPAVYCFFYRDLPEKGTLTAVTYGVSEANHHSWIHGRPELIISLDTNDLSWGIAAAMLAEAARGQHPMGYGSTLSLPKPISHESGMSSFLLFAPSFLDREQSRIELPSKTVHLCGAYPLYPGEVSLLGQIGLEAFWHMDGFDMYDVCFVNRNSLV